MKKYLIINADDFGLCADVNSAIIDLLEKKRISSATIMPNTSHYNQAMEWSKGKINQVGLHLTLVNGGSSYNFKSLSRGKTLENENGFLFLDKFCFMKNFKFKDLKREIDLQFKKVLSDGIKISHVDTHRYSIYPTYNPFVFFYLCLKCSQINVATRWCRKGSYFIDEKIPNLCDSNPAAAFFSCIADLLKVPIPDYVYKFPYAEVLKSYDSKKSSFLRLLENIPEGINEVHIHPAIDGEDIREITSTYQERIYEYQLMLDEDIIKKFKELEIELITYNDIANIRGSRGKITSLYYLLNYGFGYILKQIKIKLTMTKKF